nr:unnamed protein product [Spirometra erinaceieuropaei]
MLNYTKGGRYQGAGNKVTRNGEGKFTYLNDFFSYEGQWLNGIKHGQGRLSMKDGSFMEGQFVDGELIGPGKMYSAAKETLYEGDIFMGERHGEGHMHYPNGSIYSGSWSHNSREGRLAVDSQTVYEGDFHQDRKHGSGVLSSRLFRIAANYNEDKICGNGRVTFEFGGSYEGNFLDGKPHGEGALVRPFDLPAYSGCWHDGRPIRRAAALGLSQGKPTGQSALPSGSHVLEMTVSARELLTTGFTFIAVVLTEDGKILQEENNRHLLAWIGEHRQAPLTNSRISLDRCSQSALLTHSTNGCASTPLKSYILPFGDIIKEEEERGSVANEDARAIETSAVGEVLDISYPQEDVSKVTMNEKAQKLQPLLQREKTAYGFAKWEALKVCPKTLLQHAQVFNVSPASERLPVSRMATRGVVAPEAQRMSLEEGKDEESADVHRAENILKTYKDRLVLVVEQEQLPITNEELDIVASYARQKVIPIPASVLFDHARLAPLFVKLNITFGA